MTLRVGVIGCGDISKTYFRNAVHFRDFAFVACADLRPEAAVRAAAANDIEALSIADLIASAGIDVALNLTIPAAHAEVSLAAIAAGKHVYSEKPLATSLEDARALVAAASARGVRIGSAPDTVLGGAVQTARALIDAGAIGRPLAGFASVMSRGMEHWHPNPGFFFQAGGGPVFDMGPYYLTTLVTLLGPVARVEAMGQMGFAERVVTAPNSLILGQSIRVETLTSVQALIEFESGAQVTFLASWDVHRHRLPNFELYGAGGWMRLPDPNFFGGEIELAEAPNDWRVVSTANRIFARPNAPVAAPAHANYRGLGLAEMARAIDEGRPHRANGELALHVVEVMAGILQAAMEKRSVQITDRCDRPTPLAEDEAARLVK